MKCEYDIIGDIHGHASRLERLLRKLGYERLDGTYSHPNRRAVFTGDYVDRGPEILQTLKIVRGMVERGSAHAVMGNHEFNAITYATLADNGGWIREHTAKNYRQHSATLLQVADPFPEEWREWLSWFAQLPLSLDLTDIRIAHAAWNTEVRCFFQDITSLTPDTIRSMADPTTSAGRAREFLLSGIKVSLPEAYLAKNVFPKNRSAVRLKWWIDLRGKTYREGALPDSDDLPNEIIPESFMPEFRECYPPSAPPVFLGHYRLPYTKAPEPLAPNIACLDYDVHFGGPLVAYSWRGEKVLRRENYVMA